MTDDLIDIDKTIKYMEKRLLEGLRIPNVAHMLTRDGYDCALAKEAVHRYSRLVRMIVDYNRAWAARELIRRSTNKESVNEQ